jgi:hypothetical protein
VPETKAQVSDSLRGRTGALTAPQRISPARHDQGNLVPRQNYRQVKKQKEASRKARQLEKQQRRATRPNDSGEAATPLQDPPASPSDPTLGSGT